MRLLILQGLPGSGKTTLAKDMIAKDPTWVRVNKDDIRRELEATGWVWSRENENEVKRVRDVRISLAFERGNSVISDDTNFGKHPGHLKQLGERWGATVETRLWDTPVDECVRRDTLREGKAKVGEKVIREMWCKYLASSLPKVFARYERNVYLSDVVVCDLDGTLALFDGLRSPYDAAKCANDRVNFAVAECVSAMGYAGYHVLFLSGRSAEYREPTLEFLARAGFTSPDLFMRNIGDNRKDWIVKGELFDKHVRDKFNVLFVLDDRNQVVDFWRSIGLTVFQVAPGDF